MRRTDLLVASGIVGALVLIALALLVMPPMAFNSTTAAAIGTLHWQLLVVAVPIAILVEAVLVYTVVRFRKAEKPVPTPDNRRLEIGWTVATAVVLLFVGAASFQVLAHPDVTVGDHHAHGSHGGSTHDRPADAVEVRITGHQWFWAVEYLGENVSIENAQTIYLPVDRPIYLHVTSADVIHSVHSPGLGLKQDAFPGQENVIRTEITARGEYRLYCAEYCGEGHSMMRATIVVVSDEEYRQWLAGQRDGE